MNKKSKKYRAISIKYMGATNSKPSRIKFNDELFDQSKIISVSCSYNSIIDQGLDYLTNNGFNVVGYSELNNGYVIFCDNWAEDCLKLKDIK